MATTYTKEQDRVYVTVAGRDYDGWLESSIERSIETISSRFSIPVSLVPGFPPDIARQDEIKVRINQTVVVTGYVLAAEPFYRRDDCGFRIEGRSRTGDLVQCSAIHKGGQWQNVKLDRIARDLCQPFGIDVVVDTDLGAAINDFKLQHGETVVAALARATRLRGVLATTSAAGQLLLTKAGKNKAAGAIVRGQNVISMQAVGTDAERFSEYIVYGQGDLYGGVANFEQARQQKATAKDPDIKRYLPLVINADGNNEPADMQRLVDHTMRVRRGQAYGLKYVLEGWTFKGVPWEINTRVPVYDDIAGLDGVEWLIAEVRHTVDLREGDVTELLVRPIEAYDTVPLNTKLRRKPRKGKGPLMILDYKE